MAKFKMVLIVAALMAGAYGQSAMARPVIPTQGTWASTLHARDFDGNAATIEGYYDDSLDVTWSIYFEALTNTLKMGGANKSTAQSWLTHFQLAGVDGWRLPRFYADPLTPCAALAYTGGTCGYNADPSLSEMAHLFFVTLGNQSKFGEDGVFRKTSDGANWDTNNLNAGPFVGTMNSIYIMDGSYFDSRSTEHTWLFRLNDGAQFLTVTGGNAMLLHDGDVGNPIAVPEPSTLALTLAGVGVLLLLRRRVG